MNSFYLYQIGNLMRILNVGCIKKVTTKLQNNLFLSAIKL